MKEDLQYVIEALVKVKSLQGQFRSLARKNPEQARVVKDAIVLARDQADYKVARLIWRLDNTPIDQHGFIGSLAKNICDHWRKTQGELAIWKAESNSGNLHSLRKAEEELSRVVSTVRITLEKI